MSWFQSTNRRLLYGLLVTIICGCGLAATSLISPLEIISYGSDKSFTFSLNTVSLPENQQPTLYYVSSADKAGPIASYNVTPPLLLQEFTERGGIVPFTVIVTNSTVVTSDTIENILEQYMEDDVFTSGFLNGFQLSTTTTSQIDATALNYLETRNISYLFLSTDFSNHNSIRDIASNYSYSVCFFESGTITPPGPYISKISEDGNLSLYQVYALFNDGQKASMNGATKNTDSSYTAVEAWDSMLHELRIPFPSRLYSKLLDTEEYPLAGLRFGVKDLMGINGLPTSGGAILVGKTKLTTFAYGAWPYQTMGFSYSWNVRADGYLGLSASSYGSAAAIAAFDQLVFTIGSDTLGSVRNPADRVGCYGIRPSWDAINLEGVIPSATSLDSLGIMTRSPLIMEKVMKAWDTVEDSPLIQGNFSLPKKIIYPSEWFPANNSIAQTLIDTWLTNLTTTLGMTIEYQNVSALFNSSVRSNDTLASFTSDISSLTSNDNWSLFGKQFVTDYQTKFDGRWPEQDPQVLSAWQTGQTYTAERKEFNEERLDTFRTFFNDVVIPFNNETCTEGFWVYQIADTGGGVPEYKDTLNLDYFPPTFPMRAASIAPYARLVDVTVPIGQIPYESLISKRQEQLAITLNFVAHSGCDFVLLDFLVACEKAGYYKTVKTGTKAF